MHSAMLPLYDQIFPFNPAVVRLVREYLPASGARVLDLGCGTGKYTAALAGDHEVVGIDPDGDAIVLARQSHPGVRFHTGELHGLPDGPPFDLIFCIGNVFGHIAPADRTPFLGKVHDLLRPGGVWLLHTLHWEPILAEKRYTFPVLERGDLRFIRHYRDIQPERACFDTRLMRGDAEICADQVIHYPCVRGTLGRLHGDFVELALYADYAKNPFTAEAVSQVCVYRR